MIRMSKDQSTSLILFMLGLVVMAIVLTACGGGGGAATFPLTVVKSGTGTVTSSPAGINCGDDCTESYAQGTSVTLTATPTDSATFAGWSGACSGTTCVVTMDSAKSVTATFEDPELGHEKLISGTVQDWTGGAATVRAVSHVGQQEVTLAEGTINANGTFSLTLPGAETMGPYLSSVESFSCEDDANGEVVFTPSPLRVLEFDPEFLVFSADGSIAHLWQEDEDGRVYVSQIYSASSATITGSCATYSYVDDEPVPFTYIWDLNLTAGWNDGISEITETGQNFRTGAIPAGVGWQWRYGTVPLPPPGPPVGDISGTVTVPADEDVSGTIVTACALFYDGDGHWCAAAHIEESGTSASYTIPGLPAGQYTVYAHKSDLLGCYGDGIGFACEPTLVEPPRTGIDITMTVVMQTRGLGKSLHLHRPSRLFKPLWHRTF
jgi:hypothetical protein